MGKCQKLRLFSYTQCALSRYPLDILKKTRIKNYVLIDNIRTSGLQQISSNYISLQGSSIIDRVIIHMKEDYFAFYFALFLVWDDVSILLSFQFVLCLLEQHAHETLRSISCRHGLVCESCDIQMRPHFAPTNIVNLQTGYYYCPMCRTLVFCRMEVFV